LDPILKLK
jgi:hypothetical protein